MSDASRAVRISFIADWSSCRAFRNSHTSIKILGVIGMERLGEFEIRGKVKGKFVGVVSTRYKVVSII